MFGILRKRGKVSVKKRKFDRKLYIAVKKRDGDRCQNPFCMYKGKKLNLHHIHDWSTYPKKRFLLGNIITLCSDREVFLFFKKKGCHQKFHKSVGGYQKTCNQSMLTRWMAIYAAKRLSIIVLLVLTLVIVPPDLLIEFIKLSFNFLFY